MLMVVLRARTYAAHARQDKDKERAARHAAKRRLKKGARARRYAMARKGEVREGDKEKRLVRTEMAERRQQHMPRYAAVRH